MASWARLASVTCVSPRLSVCKRTSGATIAKSLGALFKYELNGEHVSGFKADFAEIYPDMVKDLTAKITKGPLVHALTLWFDLPPAVAAARRAAARPADRLEREDSAFFERVRVAYAQRAAQAAARFVRIDADQPPAAVWAQVQAAVAARLPV